jgi:hypothetical protein
LSIPLTSQQAQDSRLRNRLESQGFVIVSDGDSHRAVRTQFRSEAKTEVETETVPVKVVQDKKEFFTGFIVGGVIVGVLATVLGNVISELVLDDLRQAHRKFGYESSWWQRMKALKFWKLGE